MFWLNVWSLNVNVQKPLVVNTGVWVCAAVNLLLWLTVLLFVTVAGVTSSSAVVVVQMLVMVAAHLVNSSLHFVDMYFHVSLPQN